jgi:hypothetical protein
MGWACPSGGEPGHLSAHSAAFDYELLLGVLISGYVPASMCLGTAAFWGVGHPQALSCKEWLWEVGQSTWDG